jgi:hypothetical protein
MPGMALEKPPVPPEVAAQQGGGSAMPFAGVGGQMADAAAQQPPIVQAYDAVTKVIANMAKLDPAMGPFAERAQAILKAGLEAVAQKKGGGAGPGGPGPGGPPPPPQGPPAGPMPA